MIDLGEPVERSESSNGIAPRERENVECFILVYLNSISPDESVIKHLRSLVNFIKIFDDIDDCMAFINDVSNEKVIFISSNSFRPVILPKIEDLQQILNIYILSDDEEEQESASPTSKRSKLKGVYQEISIEINLVTRDLVTYVNISPNSSTLDPTFIYSQLMSEIILDKDEIDNAMKDLINFAREEYEGNDQELLLIDEFENDYQKDRAIWWFTRNCFLSTVKQLVRSNNKKDLCCCI